MTDLYQPIAVLLAAVRARWRRVVVFNALTRFGLAAAVVLAVALIASRWIGLNPLVQSGFGLAAALALAVSAVWGFRGVRASPADAKIARFIEERRPDLDERLVSAVSVTSPRPGAGPTLLAESMVADAARAAATVRADEVVVPGVLRRAGVQALAAAVAMIVLGFLARDLARKSLDATTLTLFPSSIVLEVTPGDARLETGSNLTVHARLVGNRAPVVAQLLRADGNGDEWRALEMATDDQGRFSLALNKLATSFRYRVTAGAAASRTFSVSVVSAPRVTRVDVEYSFPKAFGLQNRVEADGGDIYAPAGTDVRLHVHTDRPAASGRLVLSADQPIELAAEGSDTLFSGALKVVADSSYRITLADAGGLTSRGETEYFIRTLEDRPPEVHVVRPASDRRVTRLEEVDIEAEAQDDFGIASLELVYSVRGGAETVVSLPLTAQATSAVGRRTIYLEDLNVRAGDFLSYYVRARDIPRGRRSSEARSDIFFLEVKPFEEEFTLAQSQAAMGGGQGNQQLDDLVAAQKEIIVATWKLDRRSRAANGARSEQDIRAVGKAERELKTRVEEAGSAFRQGTMRDPRARPGAGRGAPPPAAPRAGQTLEEEDAMTAASRAMGRAAEALDGLSTANAIPPEMEALNNLLKAQADVKKRQIQQQAGNGAGNNRSTQDLSSLFDKELARHQQTNYETPNSTEQRDEQASSALDQIKDLARRQDELVRRQQDLARNRAQMTEDERKRALEQLTREQNELRQRAENVAREMAGRQQQQNQQQNQQGQQSQQGSQSPQGQSSGQPGQSGQQNRPGQSGQPRPGESQQPSGRPGSQGNAMREVSEEMRRATNELQRDDAGQASERAARALDKLRDVQRQMQNASPDGRRRALGDLQLEARQLADAERQIANESGRAPGGENGADRMRRLSSDQQRLADRLRRVQEGLTEQAGQASGGGKDPSDERRLQQAAGDAARDLDRQRLAERMEQSAESMRAAGERAAGRGQASTATPATPASGTSGAQEEIARALDRLADRLASASKAGDDESRRLTDQLTRAQDLRERMESITRQLEQLGQQAAETPQSSARSGQPNGRGSEPSSNRVPGDSGRSGQGQSGSGGSSAEIEQLRAELNKQLEQVRELLNDTRREDSTQARGGMGRTFEGQGMTLSAPGTEGFKQDFAKWQELKRQATAALESVESTLAQRLQEKETKDRLAAGADDTAPTAYQRQVDSYFKALATRKKP